MKPPRSQSDAAWENLVRQARLDAPPAIDRAALSRAIRAETSERATSLGWIATFVAAFAFRRAVASCLLASAALAALSLWQARDCAGDLAWAQLFLGTTGGLR